MIQNPHISSSNSSDYVNVTIKGYADRAIKVWGCLQNNEIYINSGGGHDETFTVQVDKNSIIFLRCEDVAFVGDITIPSGAISISDSSQAISGKITWYTHVWRVNSDISIN